MSRGITQHGDPESPNGGNPPLRLILIRVLAAVPSSLIILWLFARQDEHTMWIFWVGCAFAYTLISTGAAVVRFLENKMWLGLLLGFMGVLVFGSVLIFGLS